MDHFTKWNQGYFLKTKTSEKVLFSVESYIQSFGKFIILQLDNGLVFSNIDLNNDIKLVHRRIKLP